MPELALPAFDSGALVDLLKDAAAGCTSLDDVRRADFLPLIKERLASQQLHSWNGKPPSDWKSPAVVTSRLPTSKGKPPVLAVRIQELFGMMDTPRIAGGRVPVTLHLLGPNYRPQQITRDLRSFWQNTYPEVRKELRRRYPKHAWPEDPTTAKAERRPRGHR